MLRRLVVMTATAVVFWAAGCTPAPPTGGLTPTPTPPSATPSPSAEPTPTRPAWSAEQHAAADTVDEWYLIYNEVMRGERNPNDFVLAGRGDVVDEAQLTYNQFGLAELAVEGEIKVSALDPSKPAERERQTILVNLCEDMTGWSVLDKDGKDTLSLDSKVIRPLVATVEEWPKDGWFVTSITGGNQKC